MRLDSLSSGLVHDSWCEGECSEIVGSDGFADSERHDLETYKVKVLWRGGADSLCSRALFMQTHIMEDPAPGEHVSISMTPSSPTALAPARL